MSTQTDFGPELDYTAPIEIADGVFWVGFHDDTRNLHCNPYLIIEGDEAVLIDGGSRPEFSIVMLKILRTGIEPRQIKRLIYQHYDPDLCGGAPHFEDAIDNHELKIISHRENNVFIRYYGVRSKLLDIDALGRTYRFPSGRTLEFVHTPFSHSPGSFATFDRTTGTLFSNDIFGSYDRNWKLKLEIPQRCRACLQSPNDCTSRDRSCPIYGMFDFHRRIMTSERALRYALTKFEELPIQQIAPQHGSVIRGQDDVAAVISGLLRLDGIGIDGIR